ncbi:actin-like ATPase domain-containing protein, partial [Polychaeton citri CBS 116435]
QLPSRPPPRKPDINVPRSPQSPRTPLLGRSISSQFGSPGSFTREQEDRIIYELGARHLSVGFAGESRPRCTYRFTPETDGRLVDPLRSNSILDGPKHRRQDGEGNDETAIQSWSHGYTLYIREVRRSEDLDLIRLRLMPALHHIQHHHLQLDTTKPRRAILVIPTLLPTPLINTVLHCLFNVYAQPPSIQLLTTPIMATVGAGLRNALVVDLGWEETVVSAVGEYRIVGEGRSDRAGKGVVWETSKVIGEDAGNVVNRHLDVSFEEAEEALQRAGWVRSTPAIGPRDDGQTGSAKVRLPAPGDQGVSDTFAIALSRLCQPAETILLHNSMSQAYFDNNDLPIPLLMFKVMLSLRPDLRGLCLSHIVVTGGLSNLPGLKRRLLHDFGSIIKHRGWDPVDTYGSATGLYRERDLGRKDANEQRNPTAEQPLVAVEVDVKPARDRPYDDENDPISARAEREGRKTAAANTAARQVGVRGVSTVGPWAGASLIASLRIEGAREIEREDFIKSG